MTSKGGTKTPRRSGASLLRSGCAGLLVLALELWALEPAQEVLNPERWRCSVINPAIEGVESGTWKAVRKAREKAASWGGSRARMRSCRVAMVTGSRAASLAGLVVPIEAWLAAGWGLAMAAGLVECLEPLLPCP